MEDLSIPFDLVVVGAGINGLGIARDAAARGVRVALLEQDDICSGVSAWSGRLPSPFSRSSKSIMDEMAASGLRSS